MMSQMFVNTPALNFRSAPVVSEETRIGSVFLGQRLSSVESADEPGWVSCKAEIEGRDVTGFVSRRFLRAPLSDSRERLVASVFTEWMRFKRGLGPEHHDPFFRFVGEMWNAINLGHLDGRDRDVPWSAAAISFMVRNAGSDYANFRFAAAHSRYTHQAINARLQNDRSIPFWGFRLHEVRPEIGDIICRDNPTHGANVDYDFAASSDAYRSHTDIVMKIDSENNKLLAIGGNVGHSVKIATYDLTQGDFADDSHHTFAILKNMTDQ
jgi:hypothetical protein